MEIIGRAAVAATVLAAVLAGGATGLGLHAWKPDPLAAATGRTSADGSTSGPDASNTASASAGTKSSSPKAKPSKSASSDASSSASSSSSASASGPAFTRAALLRTYDFTDNGWAVANVTTAYNSLPDSAIMPCTTITSGDTGVVGGYAANYASNHTEAFELVARYQDEASAKRAFDEAVNMIDNCDSTAYDPKVLIKGSARKAEASYVDDIRWFNTQASADSDTLGVIGVVRAQNRIAILEMSSSSTDPDNTHKGGSTDVAALLGTTGRRLV